MKHFLTALSVLMTASFGPLCLSACTPAYTWGYESSIHPQSTQAYVRAVMARNSGDYETALYYYNEALSHTYSSKVAQERDEIKSLLKQNP